MQKQRSNGTYSDRGIKQPQEGSQHHMTEGMKGKDPDKGPPVVEGAYMFDKGYKSDNDHFAPPGAFPQDEERGNRYMKNQNDIVARDSSKMRKQKFSKIH